MIEIIVESNPVIECDDLWWIEARCATDVSKGVRLRKAIPYVVKCNKQNAICERLDGSAFEVDLTVERLLSWGREWDVVYSGMTAKVFIRGEASNIGVGLFLTD